jgi:pseudaminic acid cytidylyltransferase
LRLCLIPARGGSKRIPRKNIRPFFGIPMIVRSIQTALASDTIDHVLVSTDDDEIADVARDAGADVPFIRSAELSNDYATTLEVIVDALERVESKGASVETVCCLYATAPFVTKSNIDDAYTVLMQSKADYVFASAEYSYPIQRALRRRGNRVELFDPAFTTTRSQDLEPAYHDAGQFYWCQPDALRANRPLLGPGSAMYLLDRSQVQDIDTLADWSFAEKLFSVMLQDQLK